MVSSVVEESLDKDSGCNRVPAPMRSFWERVQLAGEHRKQATAREAHVKDFLSRLQLTASSSRKISGLPLERIVTEHPLYSCCVFTCERFEHRARTNTASGCILEGLLFLTFCFLPRLIIYTSSNNMHIISVHGTEGQAGQGWAHKLSPVELSSGLSTSWKLAR